MVRVFPQEIPLENGEKELERFEGYVDLIREGIAYFALKSLQAGDTLWCEHPADPLLEGGMREGGRFVCRTVEQSDGDVRIHAWPVPDVVLTEEERLEIFRRIEEDFSDDVPDHIAPH